MYLVERLRAYPWYWYFLFFILALMVYAASGASISGDEDINLRYGERVLDHFLSGEESQDYMKGVRGPDYAYNYTFDVIIEMLHRVFHFDDIHQVRHVANAFCGWLLILLTFLVTKRYFGLHAAIMAAIVLAVSPRLMGHMLNNPKDVPFAMGYMAGIYGIMIFADNYKRPTWKMSALVACALAISLNVRIGGFILYPFIFYVVALRLLMVSRLSVVSSDFYKRAWSLLPHAILIIILSYTLMVIVWPYALEKPLAHPFKAFDIMSNIKVGIRQLFEGDNVSSLALPKYYTLKWIGISSPIVFLLGLVLSPFLFLTDRDSRMKKWAFITILSFAAIPLAYIYVTNPNVYGGWRHSLFVYPPLAILSGVGLVSLYKWLTNQYFKWAFVVLIGFLILLPIRHIVAYHPVSYVYFNELAGGVKDAYGNYETDYYMHSIKPAVDWMRKEGIVNTTDSISVATNHGYSVSYYLRNEKNIKSRYTRYYERLNADWDYAIYVNVYIDKSELDNGMFPPSGTIHTIDVEGKPVCAIVKRPSKASVGYKTDMDSGNSQGAINKLEQYCLADKNNFEAYIHLAMEYQKLGNNNQVNRCVREAQRINPQRLARYTKR